MAKKLNALNFVTEIRKIYGGIPDATTAMNHLLDACDVIDDDQQKIADLVAACELMVDTAAPSMIVNMAPKQDDPVLEGLTMVLDSLLDKLKAALTKAKGE